MSQLYCLLVLLSGRKKDYTTWIIAIVGLFVIYLFTNPALLAKLIESFSKLFDEDSIIRVRLSEIIPAFYESNTESSFGMRLTGYQLSWNTFLSHPLEGVGVHTGYDYMVLADHIGWHCEWLDMLAEFGLLLSFCYCAFLFISFMGIYKNLKYSESKIIYRICGILFIFMGFLNPIMNGNMVLTLYLVIPSALKILEHKRMERETDE